MTQKPRAADEAAAGAAPGGSDGPESGQTERIVIRDRRRIDPTGGIGKPSGGEGAAPRHAAPEPAAAEPAAAEAAAGTEAEPAAAQSAAAPTEGELAAELESLRAQLDERTRDLQRVTAEYANYRKRVDRDRGLAAEQTIATVLAELLPILDDLDRAREHGDLVGPFGSVAEQLISALNKFGLTAFGEEGDPFDPNRHEAVAHRTSPEVTEPTCVEVMRRGYLVGDRLLRAALVTVADPE